MDEGCLYVDELGGDVEWEVIFLMGFLDLIFSVIFPLRRDIQCKVMIHVVHYGWDRQDLFSSLVMPFCDTYLIQGTCTRVTI